jgi:hypothetical protein
MKDRKNKTKGASKFVLFAKYYQGNQIAQRDDVWRPYSTTARKRETRNIEFWCENVKKKKDQLGGGGQIEL